MQDKDFDKLFSSKLDGLEIEPSAKVWKGIDGELNGNKRKHLIPFLSIAASIIVLIAAGVLFIPKKQTAVKSPFKNNVAVVKQSTVDPAVPVKAQPVTASKATMVAIVKHVHAVHSTKTISNIETEKEGLEAENNNPAPTSTTQVLAAVEPSKSDIKQTSVIDSSKTLASIKPVTQQPASPVAVAAVIPPSENIPLVNPVKKHKIRGIGDLLNVAIAAVDKRKDKIIVFADNDGDGTVVTGVNLGIFKIKKEN